MVRPWRDATGPLVRMPNAERPLGFRRGVRRGEMMERVVRRLMCSLATLATLVLVAAACSDDGGSSSTKVVSIGVLAPIDGGLTDFGRGIRNSVELAVREANAAKAVPGWTISVNAVDDSSDPKKGVTAVAGLIADKNVAAVVGPYNSGVALAVLPALSKANLALLSPSNTLTSLTLGDNAASSKRPYPNYFRLIGSDARQGVFLAAQAIKLGYKKAAVVSETKAAGKGQADAFATAYKAAGGTVTLQQTVPDGATDFAGFITAASATSPDV
ncbi:MAG: ABC transporter substrate-binding protein, partial [Actinobacteria bacterium]|nr:ABC transporter substrate-binding protein [Actinomycetota bacterium]